MLVSTGRGHGKGRASQPVNSDLAAQPTLSTSTSRRLPYMHADMDIRQRALGRTTAVRPARALTPTRQTPRLPGQPVPHARHGGLRPQLAAGDWRAWVVAVVCRPGYE
jgi:hypothetical protein